MAKNLKIRMFTALPDSIGQANQRGNSSVRFKHCKTTDRGN